MHKYAGWPFCVRKNIGVGGCMVRVLCVMDNVVSGNRGLEARHGLSFYIEAGGKKLLFDFGLGKETWENGIRLGVPFCKLDYLVFSHSHYDHCAGFLWAEKYGIHNSLCAVLGKEKAFFQEKYKKGEVWTAYLGCGFTKEYLWGKTGQQWICEDVLSLGEGLWAVGGIERIHPEEAIPGFFVKEKARGEMVPDFFEEEICLAAETGNGLAVITGCSHPGIINMLESVEKKLGRPVRAVIGGAHLTGAAKERLLWTAHELKRLGVELAALNHCTGTEFPQILEEKGIHSGYFGAGSCLYL